MLCLAQSTLLKLMVGDLTPTIGDVKRHSHLAIGRYHQHSVDQLDESMVVLDFFQVLLCSCRAVAMPLRCSAACLLGKSKGCASLIAVVPTDKVEVVANGQKLKVVDPSKTIQRNACTSCGVHMHGPIVNSKHAFNGLTFVHAERLESGGWAAPAFAAFVSSVIETGTKPEDMEGIRARLKELKLEPFDALSPPLMDMLAANTVKVNGVAKPAMS